jgi:Tol biopolymer transport system component
LWRQRFPSRAPEQITFGATEEEGLAVAPDGKSLITSIGTEQSAVWIHDAAGDRPLHSEGYAPITNRTGLFGSRPTFSPDGRRLYYLRRETPEAKIELWRADLASGSNEKVMPSFSILEYEVSSDGREVCFLRNLRASLAGLLTENISTCR